jgi:hypothetical protein
LLSLLSTLEETTNEKKKNLQAHWNRQREKNNPEVCKKIREGKGRKIPTTSVGQRQSSSKVFESVTMLTPRKRLMFHDFYYAGIEMEMNEVATNNDTFWRETHRKKEKKGEKRGRDDLETKLTLREESIKIRDEKQNNS